MKDYQELFDRVKDCWQFNNFSEALILLRTALEENPEDAQIHHLMGVCLAEIGEYAEAEEHLESALQYDPINRETQKVLNNLREHVKLVERKQEKEKKKFNSGAFDYDPARRLKTKICPSCGREIDAYSWRCRRCGHFFRTRIALRLGFTIPILIGLLIGLNFWFADFYGTRLQPAEIYNDAGELGQRVGISNTQWNCAGMGLFTARGMGYHATAAGTLINNGTEPIKKAVITIHFFGKKYEATFVWFDILAWPAGKRIDFDFPVIRPPMKSFRCEYRIKEVTLYAPGEYDESEKISVFVPQTNSIYDVNQFPVWRFQDETQIIHDSESYQGIDRAKFTSGKFLRWLMSLIPALLLNFICVLLSVILTNICEKKEWNHDLKLDTYASILIVVCFIGLNMISTVMVRAFSLIPILGGLISLFFFGVKVFLFYFFFKRSALSTGLLFIFYFCLVLGLRGFFGNFF